MLYFKNTDLADSQHVSLRTVLNWIEAAKKGKLDLALHHENGRTYIANTSKNLTAVEQLVAARKKYRNSRGYKAVTPRPEFFALYNTQQVHDIISHLDIHREFPFQYGYFDKGAEYWDAYMKRLAAEDSPNMLTSTMKLLNDNRSYIDAILKRYKKVNIIDVGTGNVLPLKELIGRLVEQGKMGRYVGVDISAAMLKIAERNIREWFDGKVVFESYLTDITHDRFIEASLKETLNKDANDTINIVTAVGGTFSNLRKPDQAFQSIHDSMNRNDLLIYMLKLDTDSARRYFDFSIDTTLQSLDPKAKMMVDLFNLNESFYDIEMGFDTEKQTRYIRLRLKVALTITFEFDNGTRSVNLNKDDTILLWRYWHETASEVINRLQRNDFRPLHVSKTEDNEYLLAISRVTHEQ